MATQITKEDGKDWERLVALWRESVGEPGTVQGLGKTWKVLRPDDENIIFELQGGFDEEYYGSRSTRSISS